jgi:hypothetical protein
MPYSKPLTQRPQKSDASKVLKGWKQNKQDRRRLRFEKTTIADIEKNRDCGEQKFTLSFFVTCGK